MPDIEGMCVCMARKEKEGRMEGGREREREVEGEGGRNRKGGREVEVESI